MLIKLMETDQFGSKEPVPMLLNCSQIRSVEQFSVAGRFSRTVSRITLVDAVTGFLGDDNEMYLYVTETIEKIQTLTQKSAANQKGFRLEQDVFLALEQAINEPAEVIEG